MKHLQLVSASIKLSAVVYMSVVSESSRQKRSIKSRQFEQE